MSREYSYSRRLWRWLERFGFTDDPFAVYEADQERPYLHEFFVDRPYLHHILGDPTRPQAAFLMAGRGHGKTATREMVAYECKHAQLRRRALAVRYYDFGPLLEQIAGDLKQLSTRHYVRTIVRFVLKALADEVPPTYFDLLDEMERAMLGGYADTFADPISHLKLGRIVPDKPVGLDWEALSPIETLGTLAELITRLGQSAESRYQAIYVLVDRVDETAAGPEAAMALLKPLVSEGPLLEMANVAFKFFLPIQVGEQLRQTVNLRPDRLYIQTITWDEGALQKMVQQRLSYYSEGRTERLEELCTSGAKGSAMERLIRTCEGSPRTLLRLCRALIHRHVADADETSTLITHTELIDTLRDFGHQLEVEHTPPSPTIVAKTMPAAPIAPPQNGLYLDQNGHVWIDGEPLVPPLSQLEFRLLEALYRQAPEIVPHEALIEAVWPSSAWMSNEDAGDRDEQNLRKLVDRLRKRLPGSTARFVKNVRGRGYWLKIHGNSGK
jgi:DNA-binding winged helix-turn-helix (wHTH) protein